MGKMYTLSGTVAKFVDDGDSVAISGFTTNRKPFTAAHKILGQGRKDFILNAGANGGDADLPIDYGRVKAYINCYTANSGYTNVSRWFRTVIENGNILFEGYSQDAVMLMLRAVALGFPYAPSRLMIDTGFADKWGTSREIRKTIDKLLDEKFVIEQGPMKPEERLLLPPVPETDVVVIHIQMASPDGACRILGGEFQDTDIAGVAKKVTVTYEELVSNKYIRRDPGANTIPGSCADVVVHTPHSAHPSQCYDYYDYDSKYYKEYDVASKTQEVFDAFCQEWIFSTSTHADYLNKIGGVRLANLKVVPGLDYHVDMTAQVKEEKK